MAQAPPLHVAAVFQDASWARRGVEALIQDGFLPATLSLLAAQERSDVGTLVGPLLTQALDSFHIKDIGPVLGCGPFLAALQGEDEGLVKLGLTGSVRRAGFLPHDGQVFQKLIVRGGVLIAVLSEPRAGDALARFHSYGGANAAIGAWSGRV